MKLKVEILKVETKELKTIIGNYERFNEFIWEDGNYSCDCNRQIFFDDIGYQDNIACSEGRFLVRISNNDSGIILYDEIKEKR